MINNSPGVIVELAGGLGNQLFQYAFGKATALRNDCELFLDTRFLMRRDFGDKLTYKENELGTFGLDKFVLDDQSANKSDELKSTVSARLFRKTLVRLSSYVKEDVKRYRRDYLKLKAPVYLSGFWQNPRYFNEFTEQIKKDLSFPSNLSVAASEYLKKIKNCEVPVSLHIRRGDYLKHANLQGICTTEYYQKCLEMILQKHKNIIVFIFSDDHEWVKVNIDFGVPMVVIEHTDKSFKDYEDLLLMSECQHHVIANSSFSWWGAWLGKNPNKIVCAPSKWDGRRKSKDIVEDNWILVGPS